MMDDVRVPILLAVAGLAIGPSSASARPAGWPSAADAQVMRDSAVVQVTRTMSLDLPGGVEAAFPLFGPVDEAKWAPGWSPRFDAPNPGAQTPDGAVFTTGESDDPIVWLMTDFDPVQHLVRYVYVRPAKVAVQLWISVDAVSANTSRAEVTYRYTLLGPDGRRPIDHFIASFPDFKQHWEEHIGAALAAPAGQHHHP